MLNIETALKSLSTPDAMVYARQDYASRWLICKSGTTHKAMFYTAAVWSGSSHLDTGNYVPEGQTPPGEIPEARIQRIASNRCQIDYIVNTQYDRSLFEYQEKLEELVQKNSEFNKVCRPRRNWQRGDSGYNATFTLSAQMFVRPYGYNLQKLQHPSYVVHPRVRDAVKPSGTGKPEFYPNPYRPESWDCTNGRMTRIANASPPFLQPGDIVWMSFFVEFIIGTNSWATQFTPRHFIRVATIPAMLIPVSTGDNDKEPEFTIEEGAPIVLCEWSVLSSGIVVFRSKSDDRGGFVIVGVDFPMVDETLSIGGSSSEGGAIVGVLGRFCYALF
ncbi:hypothetical protein LXA43DRAFT_902658 [Ganoderma leucocontextum]|nr:hypothetical protein LXA43DRAFT_902658 [Ganoderma leucocontextum]